MSHLTDAIELQQTKSVLIIDDELDICEALTDILTFNHYQCEVFNDPQAAMVWLRQTSIPIHLILTDVNMLGMSGIDVLDHVYVHEPTLPVVLMSGMEVKEIERRLEGRQMAGILTKPFSISALLETVNHALAG